jgi:endonuclease
MSERDGRLRGVRLIVARCEVTYTGRLNAYLPESTRLLILKDDGSVLVHADAGGYKPLNRDLTKYRQAA